MVNKLVIVLRIEFDFILDPSVPCIKQLVVAIPMQLVSAMHMGGGSPFCELQYQSVQRRQTKIDGQCMHTLRTILYHIGSWHLNIYLFEGGGGGARQRKGAECLQPSI